MLYCSRTLLLSVLWRPHSEQIKCWIAASATDPEVLPLARNYLHDLDLKSALVTFDDGIELVELLQKIRYPKGSHVVSGLAKHLEASSKDMSAADVRQLAVNLKLSGGNFDFYEATLNSPAFFAAFSSCMRTLESTELLQLALNFCRTSGQKTPHSNHFASHLTQNVSNELAYRLNSCADPAAFLSVLAAESIPMEHEQWENLKNAAFAQTAQLSKTQLKSLLQTIAERSASSPNSAWGSVIEKALVKCTNLHRGEMWSVLHDLIRCGCTVSTTYMARELDGPDAILPEDLLRILSARQETLLRRCAHDVFSVDLTAHIQAYVEEKLSLDHSLKISHDSLQWLYCLSFLSAEKAAASLRTLCPGAQEKLVLSAKDAVLLCRTMINNDDFPPEIVHSVSTHVESGGFDQSESVAMLYTFQKCCGKAPQGLLKMSAGRAASRLVSSRLHASKGDLFLPLRDFVTLLAALSFVDDAEQRALLERLLQLKQLTPAVAMRALRLTHCTKTQACVFMRSNIVRKLIEVANALCADELSFTMSVLAELQIRDVAIFELLIRELGKKSPSVKDIVTAGKAARALRFGAIFEQMDCVQTLHTLPSISATGLLTILMCCGAERRRHLLSSKEMRMIMSGIPLSDASTPELLLLFVVSTANQKQKSSIVGVMKTRDPITRHEGDVDDAVAALECAVSAVEVECICKLCTNMTPDFREVHLMRLLRCGQSYSTIPNGYYRFVGRVILLLSSKGQLSRNAALLWAKFYVDHNVRDITVGKRLVQHVGPLRLGDTPETRKLLQKAAKIFGAKHNSKESGAQARNMPARRLYHEFLDGTKV